MGESSQKGVGGPETRLLTFVSQFRFSILRKNAFFSSGSILWKTQPFKDPPEPASSATKWDSLEPLACFLIVSNMATLLLVNLTKFVFIFEY